MEKARSIYDADDFFLKKGFDLNFKSLLKMKAWSRTFVRKDAI